MPGDQRFQRENLTADVADHIAGEIILGELQPDEPLREQPLARELEVSRGTVREALLLLERRHLAVISPRRGARVAPLDRTWVREIHEVWYHLFELLLVHLARDAEDEQLLDLQRAVGSLASSSTEKLFQHIDAVVWQLCAMHGEGVLTRFLRDLWPAAQRCFHYSLRQQVGEGEATIRFAETVLEAALARDETEVSRQVRGFAGEQLERVERSLDRRQTA